MMGNFTLGLDLGTNSIGWALVDFDDNQQPKNLIACGSRIFQEAVEAKTGTPKNHARRAARAARKLVARRKQRRTKLLNLLVRHDLLPQDGAERNALLLDNQANNPYQLRRRGLDEKLEPFAFGRALYHLAHRRGFQSNRKTQLADILKKHPDILALLKHDEEQEEKAEIAKLIKRQEKAKAEGKTFNIDEEVSADKKEGVVKAAIGVLRQKIEQAGFRTLGEHLAAQPTQRRQYTERAMYEEEFELLWNKQASFAPEQLTQALKAEVHNAIFFQRPLKSQKHLVGKCTFEPTRKRAAKATLLAQHFRILQDVNNLAVKNPITREFRPLTQDERSKLAETLDKQKSMTWGAVRRLLGWNKKDSLHEGETFNLEEGKKDCLPGNRTACDLRGALGDRWDALTVQQQDDLITDMLTIDRKDALIKRLLGTAWNFSAEQAYALAITELEPGYASLSAKAMRAIMPYLEQGLNYQLSTFMSYSACPDEKKKIILDLITTKQTKFDKACELADWKEVISYQNNDKLGLPSNVRNPVVQKALFETRKVVNAIVHKYGKPATIRVEMARDMKLSKRQKEELQKEQNKLKKANELAEGILRKEFGIQQPARADIQKYNLWLECKEVCPYTGTVISREMLFSPEVDVEHILPYSRSLDDSYMNKTLCMATYNRQTKLNNTPYEIGQGDPVAYAEIFQRIKTLPFPKRRRFEQKEIEKDKFIERQLNDTRYICVEVRDFLQQLGAPVEISKGEATAKLRGRWKLNTLLSPDGSNEKNRADHRHHAIDAVVIALTNRSLFHKLSRLSTQSISLDKSRFDVPQPWDGFYDDVYEKIDQVIVSHAPARKISGALHEDTAHGYSDAEKCFVYRKPLNGDFTLAQVNKIRDAEIKKLVIARLKEFDPEIEKALDESLPKKSRRKLEKPQEKALVKSAFGNPNYPLLHKDGKTPIRSVRIKENSSKEGVLAIKGQDGKEYKYHPIGNNHHVEIFEHPQTEKREGKFITAVEAAHRARIAKTTIVQRDYGDEWKFVMSLSVNDLVAVENGEKTDYYRVQLLDGSNENILFRLHNVATLTDNSTRLFKNANTLRCKKVFTDALGNLAPCND